MPTNSTDRSSTFRSTRISIALLLTVLLLFPNGILAENSNCGGTSNWIQSSISLPTPLETSAATVNGNYLYVLGGYAGNATTPSGVNTVNYIQLNSTNGSLTGPWKTANHLLSPLSRDLCGVVYNNGTNTYIYYVGGVDYTTGGHGNTTADIEYAKVNSDGSISSTWAQGPSIAASTGGIYKTCPMTFPEGPTIYVAGGENGGSSQSSVYYATQGANGVLSSWQPATSLLHIDAAQAISLPGNIMVLMGGDSSGMGTDWCTVYEGEINVLPPFNPAIIGWSIATQLPAHVSRNAGATYNGYVYSIGGLVAASPNPPDTAAINYLNVLSPP